MNPLDTFCPNLTCPARGQRGQGNIGIHEQATGRYICHVCHTPFSGRQGTLFYRRRTPEELIIQVVTLVAHGCPPPAITAAFGVQERTVRAWVAAAGTDTTSLLPMARTC